VNHKGQMRELILIPVRVMPSIQKFMDRNISIVAQDARIHEKDSLVIVTDDDGVVPVFPIFLPIHRRWVIGPSLKRDDDRFSIVDESRQIVKFERHITVSGISLSSGKLEHFQVTRPFLFIRSKDLCEDILTKFIPPIRKYRHQSRNSASVWSGLSDHWNLYQILWPIAVPMGMDILISCFEGKLREQQEEDQHEQESEREEKQNQMKENERN